MKSKLLIPFAPVESLLKEHSKQRISSTATEHVTHELVRKGQEISLKALDFAKHAGRQTITAKDIRLAYDTRR
jgi:histone H3/H4